MARLIAFLTDYGYVDTYVAQVKAVLLRLCPTCEVLDLTHGVPPQQVRSGAYLLATALPYLPDGTVVIAVVDPGVGTARRAIGVQGTRHTYFAPDNGLLSLALRDDPPQRAVVLDNPRYHLPQVSATFHGRDIFAPAAAHFANGIPLEQLGTPIPPDSLVQLPHMEPEREGTTLRCRPLHIDHFGNVVFNLHEAMVQQLASAGFVARVQLVCRDASLMALPLKRTFGEVAHGAPLAYWGSSGYLEVAINGASAAAELQIDYDTELIVELSPNATR
ncbi:MAG: SAM-dependent chlorinase/fluorinase [Fimbriimonadales bacterium]|nr:SAM-dependent chlorinase/fluorinase [Fimbriimonadales bacterium]MDW8052617.1 SAM-dependent chlorinase/fluorinase [Armatimonadota bacterium]